MMSSMPHGAVSLSFSCTQFDILSCDTKAKSSNLNFSFTVHIAKLMITLQYQHLHLF